MNTMIIICTKCDREFRVETTGVLVQEYFLENKEVYRVWSADLMKCPKCGLTIVSRFADKPIAEHWDKEKMDDILLQASTRTFGKDLFAWMEFVKEKSEIEIVTVMGKVKNHFKKPETEIAAQGKPEDA